MDFKTWSETTEVVEQIPVDRLTQRDVYVTPNGTRIIENTHIPYNFFKQISVHQWVENLDLRNTPENHALVAKYGGRLDEVPYGEDDMMWAVFSGENGMENAYNFVQSEKENILKEFYESI